MSPQPGKVPEEPATATRRRRELYKYFVPPGSTFSTNQTTVPDTVLTAHAQLVAWRLNCSRAVVSLIDTDIQYFVAEASKTLHLDDNTLYDEPSDAIWAGCVAVPASGRLCEHTIAQLPREDGDPAYFEVVDLTKDNRFDKLPFVTAEPFFKYYCGVPLKTNAGVPIGSLFALDDKVREPIGRDGKRFLATMAENVMTHYENQREKEDRKRVQNMNMCLAAFVDPENQIKPKKRRLDSQHSSSMPSRRSLFAEGGLKEETKRKTSHRSRHSSHHPHDSDDQSDGTASTQSRRVDDDDNIETFKRAADLLHAALGLEKGGGVVFMDTATSYRSNHKQQKKPSDQSSLGADSDREAVQFKRRGSLGAATLHSSSSWGPPRPADPPQLPPTAHRVADILASTVTPQAADHGQHVSRSDFSPLVYDDLARLIRRNPRGRFYNLESDGLTGSNSSGEEAIYALPRARAGPSKSEAALISKHFPDARQIIFLPLWDSTASRFSTLFAYTTSDFRTFSSNPDYLYCIAFCNCVMTEITRMATLAADQQKSDFIGSVSHELRSPLHGILASCEFLTDTDTSTFQQSLIDTADSCARTLLDTINMVLDYSKINAFERNARKVRKRSGDAESSLAVSGQQPLNIFGNVDLASITEEVVEGVATGQVFKDSLTGVDALDLADASKQSFSGNKEVEIVLDISPRASAKDWIFVTQPGAFRRIIMNIFGNALKYTRKGFIRVRLEAQAGRRASIAGTAEEQATLVKLTITDTGQGMSPQFMRTKLYTPFAQENSIAPGTGLGLSLVKSMVTMLNGEIHIESALGVGTEVTVTFPMTVVTPTNTSDSNSTPSSAGSIERVKDDSLMVVQKKARTRRAVLYPDSHSESISDAGRMVRHAVNKYLTGWYGFEVVAPFSLNNLADIIITDEADLPALLKILPGDLSKPDDPMVIVLATAATRKSDKNIIARSDRIEAVSYPFGPYKLAKSIRWCLDRLDKSAVQETEAETQATAAAEKPELNEVMMGLERVTLHNPDSAEPDVNLVRAGGITANEDSVHAQLVVESSTESGSSGGQVERTEYPFPDEPKDGTVSPSNLEAVERQRPVLPQRKTISPTRTEIASQHAEAATPMSSKGIAAVTPLPTKPPHSATPRLLLVDDNKVNLRLLQTFMRKRKYTDVFSAEDGAQAVSTYRDLITAAQPHPPDIIFMDISMPVMNGFQATREIREIEQQYQEQFPSPMERPASSLIIALTGLNSGRDQSEAFTSGFDLFLTKPTSFREVGRLLDNWEKNGNATVPHGALTGQVDGLEEGSSVTAL